MLVRCALTDRVPKPFASSLNPCDRCFIVFVELPDPPELLEVPEPPADPDIMLLWEAVPTLVPSSSTILSPANGG